MIGIKVLIYLFLLLFVGYFIHLMVNCIGKFARRNVPFVPSCNDLRDLVINVINNDYKYAKIICEMGSGYGGLSRYIARNTGAYVVGLENVPYYAFLSMFLDVFCGKNNKTILTDAYKYLENMNGKFDVIVAYMGPDCTARLKDYKDKADVVISLDFEIVGIKPKKIVELGRGATIYKGQRYPHKLFVYEF